MSLSKHYSATVERTINEHQIKDKFVRITIDPYVVLAAYNITNPAQQHAIKKLLRAGNSDKSLIQDIKESRDSLIRMIQILELEEEVASVKKKQIVKM